jgi:hypothetical protein
MNLHNRPEGGSLRRSRILNAVVKALGVAALDFILLRIGAPNLINMHQDLALAGAILCLILAFVVTGWWIVSLWSDVILPRRRRRRLVPHSQTIED